MATTHHLKCAAPYFDAIARGDKTFEVRKDDRVFQSGDTLLLTRIDDQAPGSMPWEQFTLGVIVTFVLQGGQFGIEPGYVVMAIRLPDQAVPA